MNRWFVLGLITILLASSIVAVFFITKLAGEDEYSRYPHYPFYVSISADGSNIIARYRAPDGFVQLFSQENNTPIWTALYPTSWINSASISADGGYVVIGTRDGSYLFSKDDNTILWSTGAAHLTAISSDGAYIATAGGLNIFSRENNEPLGSFPIGDVKSMSMSENGDYISLGAGELCVFSRVDNMLSSYTYPDKSVSISADGSYIVIGEGKYFYLFNRVENILLWSYEFSENHNLIGEALISADGNYMIVDGGGTIYSRTIFPQGGQGGVYLFSKTENIPRWTYWSDGWVGRTYSSISSDGNFIVIGHERKFYLFGRADNTPIWSYEFPEHTYGMSVSISADGNYIVIGTEGGPAANIGGSVYLFNRDGNILWSYYHEVEPYPIG